MWHLQGFSVLTSALSLIWKPGPSLHPDLTRQYLWNFPHRFLLTLLTLWLRRHCWGKVCQYFQGPEIFFLKAVANPLWTVVIFYLSAWIHFLIHVRWQSTTKPISTQQWRKGGADDFSGEFRLWFQRILASLCLPTLTANLVKVAMFWWSIIQAIIGYEWPLNQLDGDGWESGFAALTSQSAWEEFPFAYGDIRDSEL